MTQKKVLFIDQMHPFLQEQLTKWGFQCDLKHTASKEEIAAILQEYEGIAVRSRLKITADLIDKATQLKFIARAGAGLESIDVDYARQKGIACLSSPEGNRDSVAEHALGMLLSMLNNLNRSNREVKQGLWRREANRGTELMGKTVGIVGYGYMGNAFAKRLQGFGVEVIAYDKFKTDYGNEYAEAVTLEELQQRADVVSFHIYWTPENDKIVNDTYLSAFKKPIYLINTARGKILETADLVKHLKSGKVLGAALDVLEYEGHSFHEFNVATLPDAFQYLTQADNVILSPHIAGWTHESELKHVQTLAKRVGEVYGV
ncbi:MAG: NAD(P)-dependent oxidoreductase [Chitinophagales bacterium]